MRSKFGEDIRNSILITFALLRIPHGFQISNLEESFGLG